MLSCHNKQERDQLELSKRFPERRLGRGKAARDKSIGSPGTSVWRSHLSRETSAWELLSREMVVSHISVFFANAVEKKVFWKSCPEVVCAARQLPCFTLEGVAFLQWEQGSVCSLDDVRGPG